MPIGAGGKPDQEASAARPDSSRNPPPRKKTVPRSGPLPNSRWLASPQRVAVEHLAALGVGWVQQHAAAQHVHAAMITKQTHSGRDACSRPLVEENPNGYAGKCSRPKLWPFFTIRTRG